MSIDPSCFPNPRDLRPEVEGEANRLQSKGFSVLWLALAVAVLLGGMTVAAALAHAFEIDNENASYLMLFGGTALGALMLGLARGDSVFRESLVASVLVAATFIYLMARNDMWVFLWTASLLEAALKAAISILLGVAVGGLMGRRNAHRLDPQSSWRGAGLSFFGGAGVLFLGVMIHRLGSSDADFSDAGGFILLLFAASAFVSGFLTQANMAHRAVASSGAGMAVFVVFSGLVTALGDGLANAAAPMIGGVFISLLAWGVGSAGAKLGWSVLGRDDVREGAAGGVPSAQLNK